MKDVIVQYQSNQSSFAQSFEPISKLPTITICFRDLNFDYNQLSAMNLYKIKYQSHMKENGIQDLSSTDKDYFFELTNETVRVEQISVSCFKVCN